MQLQKSDIYFLCQCALSAAYKAGIHIQKQAHKTIQTHTKEEKDTEAAQVVTQIDIDSQNSILSTLRPTIEQYNIGVLTEESSDDGSRFTKEYFWAIDPLDGTLPFIQKQHGYSVAIGLVDKHGAPIIGVVYDPLRQNMYYASMGNGAFKNSLKLPIIHHADDSIFHLYFNQSITKEERYQSIVSDIEKILPDIGCTSLQVYATAGAAMNACMVLGHSKACYITFPKKGNSGGSIWDFAATAAIFNEAYAVVTDMYGNKLELNRKESTLLNHKGVLFASNTKIADMILATTESYTSVV